MAITFSDKEWEVFCNIVSGVESGGQIYGNGDWGNITEAFTNTPNESAVTLGCYQFFGVEAGQLLNLFYKKYPDLFIKYNSTISPSMRDIAHDMEAAISDPDKYWSNYRISKNSAKAKVIKDMISSPEGIICQKELFKSNSQKLLEYAYNLGITDHKALAMAMQIAHLGGTSALKRIISKTSKPYTVASIDAALRTDNQNSSQVGAKIFRSRHDCVIKWLDQYWPKDNTSTSNSSSNSSNVNNNTGGKTSMAKTYPAGYISNSGHDENNNYYGGRAGDQTGTEWQIRSWYNRPWTQVLHYPDANVRKTIAQLAIEAALNNNIGYDQYERTTFWYQLAKVGYHPANIKTPCESDCSAGATACCKAAGYLHNISGLKNLSPDNYTGSMVSAFRAAGFEIRTASKYLSSPDYVCAGDVLLNDHHHTTICISSGVKTGEGLTVYDENSISTTTSSSSSSSSSSNDALNETVKSYIYANKAQVALRTWAGKDNSQLKSFPTVVKGQKLGLCDTVKASDGSTWYFVKIEDKYGFVDSADTSTTEPTASTTATNSTNGGSITINGVSMTVSNGSKFNTTSKKWTGICNAKILNLRRWAGTDSALLSSVPNIKYGTTVYVYDVLLDSEGAPWLYIKVKNPTTGKYVWAFCYAAYITKV